MTKATKMTFAKAVASINDARELNATNKKKVQKCALIASNADVIALLTESECDIAYFNAKALYTVEKVLESAKQCVETHADASKNLNMLITLKCASLCAASDVMLKTSDIESAILAQCAVNSERSHLIYERKSKISEKVQVSYCIAALRIANVLQQVSAQTFKVNNNAFLQAFNAKFADIAI